jgi:hypothetical protein
MVRQFFGTDDARIKHDGMIVSPSLANTSIEERSTSTRRLTVLSSAGSATLLAP